MDQELARNLLVVLVLRCHDHLTHDALLLPHVRHLQRDLHGKLLMRGAGEHEAVVVVVAAEFARGVDILV